jgi:hypothetical protein
MSITTETLPIGYPVAVSCCVLLPSGRIIPATQVSTQQVNQITGQPETVLGSMLYLDGEGAAIPGAVRTECPTVEATPAPFPGQLWLYSASGAPIYLDQSGIYHNADGSVFTDSPVGYGPGNQPNATAECCPQLSSHPAWETNSDGTLPVRYWPLTATRSVGGPGGQGGPAAVVTYQNPDGSPRVPVGPVVMALPDPSYRQVEQLITEAQPQKIPGELPIAGVAYDWVVPFPTIANPVRGAVAIGSRTSEHGRGRGELDTENPLGTVEVPAISAIGSGEVNVVYRLRTAPLFLASAPAMPAAESQAMA